MPTIRVELPAHLRTLAGIKTHEVTLEITNSHPAGHGESNITAVLDALEAAYPMLCGTIRDHATRERRDFLRFFACQRDLSLEPIDSPLPGAVAEGREPLIILGAVAGG
jgi:molybdopterin synthase sulfur carrier subunit